MPPYKTKLKDQKSLCAGTTAFYFEKPEDLEFEAGQFFNFTLLSPDETDLEGNTRALSIASAPHERNLMVATHPRTTAFKRTLNSLPPGTELILQGPFGSMTLPRNTARPRGSAGWRHRHHTFPQPHPQRSRVVVPTQTFPFLFCSSP